VGGARALGSVASGSGSRTNQVRPDAFLDGVRVLVVEFPEPLESLERERPDVVLSGIEMSGEVEPPAASIGLIPNGRARVT
jgi:hypothetical protein